MSYTISIKKKEGVKMKSEIRETIIHSQYYNILQDIHTGDISIQEFEPNTGEYIMHKNIKMNRFEIAGLQWYAKELNFEVQHSNMYTDYHFKIWDYINDFVGGKLK